MKKIVITYIVVTLSIVYPLLSSSQLNANSNDDSINYIYQSIIIDKVYSIMKSLGYTIALDKNNETDYIMWLINNDGILVLVHDKVAIQAFGFIRTEGTEPDLFSVVNSWNKDKPFTRAYVDDSGDPVLEMDFDLTGGVREAAIRDFLQLCFKTYSNWFDAMNRFKAAP